MCSKDLGNWYKYLIVVKEFDILTRQATRILHKFEPENIQGYVEPGSV